MKADTRRAKVERLRELHRGEGVPVLPNARDAPSARMFEDCGFEAVATASAGIACALGYPDGERPGRDEMTEVTSRITALLMNPGLRRVLGDRQKSAPKRAAAASSSRRQVVAMCC